MGVTAAWAQKVWSIACLFVAMILGRANTNVCLRQKCSEKCQIWSDKLNVSGLALLQYVDLTMPSKKTVLYARTERARMKDTVNKLEV